MQGTMTTDELVAARGTDVYASDGDKIGKVEEIFVDEQTSEPEWIGLSAGMLGTKRVLVPVPGAERREDGFYVPYSKDQVKGAPDIDADEISQETEGELYSYYGLGYSEAESDTGLPEGEPRMQTQRGTTGEADVVRSEEELKVGKRGVETGRARLRKWVETEPVDTDVELQRERVRVEREPIDQPVSSAELGEEEVEVPVHAEEAVVQKDTVAKERVSLEKDLETERQRVTDEVRKERVEVEGDENVRR